MERLKTEHFKMYIEYRDTRSYREHPSQYKRGIEGAAKKQTETSGKINKPLALLLTAAMSIAGLQVGRTIAGHDLYPLPNSKPASIVSGR